MSNVYVAKPYVNNNKGLMEFSTVDAAVKYLSSFLPHDWPNLKADDWHLVGKLSEKSGDTSWLKGKLK